MKNDPPVDVRSITFGQWVVGAALVLILGSCMFRGSGPAPDSAQLAESAWQKDGIALAHRLRDAVRKQLREPESFAVAEASLKQDGTVCIVYRARNGFGGTNVERAAARRGGAEVAVTAADVAAACDGKPGSDIGWAL